MGWIVKGGLKPTPPTPTPPAPLKWKCADSSDKCVQDQTGTYLAEQDCEKNCGVPEQYKSPWTAPSGSTCSGMPPTDGGGGKGCTDYIQSNWPRAGGVLPADDLKDASNSCCKVYNTDKISCDICIDAAIPSGPTPPKTEPDPIIDAWCTDNHEMLFSECYIHAAMECKHNSNCTDDPAAAARRKCCGNEITPIVGDVCSPTSKGAWDGKFVRGQTGTLTDPGPFYLCNIWFPPPPLHDDAV